MVRITGKIHHICCPQLLVGSGILLLEKREDVHNVSAEIIPDNFFGVKERNQLL